MSDTVGESFARLALAIDQHAPGYVEVFLGPAVWRQQAQDAGPRPLVELACEAAALLAAVAADAALDTSRMAALTAEIRAMTATLRILQGAKLSLREEAEEFFDIAPQWVDETHFAEAHRTLDQLLPPGDSLLARNTLRVRQSWIRPDRLLELSAVIAAELHKRTRARFPLPDGETFGLRLVQDRPWTAYTWYLGGLRSTIEISYARPIHLTGLVDLLAHEGYPGHHTEAACKEARLLRENGWHEFSVALVNGPSCTISEGMGNRALEMAFPGDELVAWYRGDLFPRAGLGHLDPTREVAVDSARASLEGVTGNAAILLLQLGTPDDEVESYVMRYGIATSEEARRLLANIRELRSYVFTYRCGGELLDALFSAHGSRDPWFGRLLSEPVSPGLLRSWVPEAPPPHSGPSNRQGSCTPPSLAP